jgi:FkbM family methyltransferase
MKALIKVIKFIIQHPISSKSKISSLIRFFWWQLRCLVTDKAYVYTFSPNAKLILRKGMTGATGNLYCGLHEYAEMLFLLHYLRKEDVFVDVGANIGSYTLLASAEIGAKSFSFEPVPSTFKQLKDNIEINKLNTKATIFNIGLASKKGSLLFSIGSDSSMNHVQIQNVNAGESISVEIDTMNARLKNVQANLLKIDVEGFEQEVLMGATNILESTTLNAIIIELNSSGLNYGYSDEQINSLLEGYGFYPFTYQPFLRELTSVKYTDHSNIIYIRDLSFVEKRVKAANKIKILNLEI